ncbi:MULTISPECIES: ATP-dependent helicase [unclassified Bradyrhizobium]|uniref:ATP-dependent helicase n=1 Tax=unclassified Bradyrhizobium TaxID=2631580 RepID=UPI002916AF53|nr:MULTISPECIES: ATP-dependent helicase [unclassified Bradyrhizobium]
MTDLSPQQQTIVGLPLSAICVTACAGSGKTRTATHRLWQARQLMSDKHGIAALLSFSNVAVDTFRRDYRLLARERAESSNFSAIEIDTVDGFLTANVIRPHAFRSMRAKRTPYLVQGHEPFLKGQTVYDGSRPHPIANLEVGIDGDHFKFSVRFGYSSVPIHSSDAVKAINRLGATGAYTHCLGRYWAIKTLREQPFVLRALSRRYPTILVDEAQDIGPAHQAILELLIDNGCQLSLIGDTNQGIYEFSGATGQFLADYSTRPGVQPHGLTVNYRSVPAIVKVANQLSGREDTSERTTPSTLSGAFYVTYKKAEKSKLEDTFRSMLDTAGIAHADATILCRSAEWVNEWRGGNQAQGQGAIRAFVNATISRDKLRRYDDAFRFACIGITAVLADEHGDLAVRIARNDERIDALSLRRVIWRFARDPSSGLPSGTLVADSEWHSLLVKRLKILLVGLEAKYALRPAANLGNRLAKKALSNEPILEMPDLASKNPSTFDVSTVHQVKGESIEAVMYVANREQARALLDGTETEVGRIGYVAATRARDLFILAVPESCVTELEPELIGCGFKKAGS